MPVAVNPLQQVIFLPGTFLHNHDALAEDAANRRFAAAVVMDELLDDGEQRAAWLVNNALNSIVQALSLDMVRR
jgi:hypothetical protein